MQNHGGGLDFGSYGSLAAIPFSHSNKLLVYGPEKYYLPLRNDIKIFPIPQGLTLLFLRSFPQGRSDLDHEMDAIL